jgi:hypothetical protein
MRRPFIYLQYALFNHTLFSPTLNWRDSPFKVSFFFSILFLSHSNRPNFLFTYVALLDSESTPALYLYLHNFCTCHCTYGAPALAIRLSFTTVLNRHFSTVSAWHPQCSLSWLCLRCIIQYCNRTKPALYLHCTCTLSVQHPTCT